jgi:mannose-6-phosphate isomerase-like protein (cupin superfamily)
MPEQFNTMDFTGPVPVLTREQCRRLIAERSAHHLPLVPDWSKGLAVVSPSVFRVATIPAVLERVKEILGNDIILWGASFVTRHPGQLHHWHNDIEASVSGGKTISVWIGIRNCSKNSSLQFISGSHRFKESIQEMRHRAGLRREELTSHEVLHWAKQKDPDAVLVVPELRDGNALFFDGWLWHASNNTGHARRTALLLQFATPATMIRMPDPHNFEWPFKTLQHPKPPCILISGSDHSGVNRIVPAPVVHDGKEVQVLTTRIYQIGVPLSPGKNQRWEAFPIFRGSTPNLQSMCCHVSALHPGNTPHPPHHHREEEILILLRGGAEVTLPDLAAQGLETVVQMQPGDFVYYPAWFFHTITAKGDVPANYLMLKWYNVHAKAEPLSPAGEMLRYRKYSISDVIKVDTSGKKFIATQIFLQRTDCLHALQCHTSVVQPGGGYASHADAHDVVIITLRGTIACLGEQVGPFSVLFFPAGQSHDMHNPTLETAEYLVFEFHGNHPPPVRRKKRTMWQKMKDPKSWRNKFGELKTRLTGAASKQNYIAAA